MHNDRQQPGNGIRKIQHRQILFRGKHGINPNDPAAADSHDGQYHRHERSAHAAQSAYEHFHQPAQKIHGCDDGESVHPVSDDFRVFVVEKKKLRRKYISRRAERHPYDGNDRHALHEYKADVFQFVCAVILRGEGQARLRNGIHGRIHKAFDTRRRGVARHGDIAEDIDGRLNDDVGKGKNRPLHARRQTDMHDLFKRAGINMHLLEAETAVAFPSPKHPKHCHSGNRLRSGGSDRHARNAHIEPRDQPQIQTDVDEPRKAQDDERAFGISAGAENGRAEVVKHGKRHADEIDLKVKRSLIDDVDVGFHPFQKEFRAEETDHADDDSAYDSHGDGRMYDTVGFFLFARADPARHGGKRPHAEPYKEIGDQIDERARRPDRRHGGMSRKLSHDDDIRGVI